MEVTQLKERSLKNLRDAKGANQKKGQSGGKKSFKQREPLGYVNRWEKERLFQEYTK